jgi:hypothetical protein
VLKKQGGCQSGVSGWNRQDGRIPSLVGIVANAPLVPHHLDSAGKLQGTYNPTDTYGKVSSLTTPLVVTRCRSWKSQTRLYFTRRVASYYRIKGRTTERIAAERGFREKMPRITRTIVRAYNVAKNWTYRREKVGSAPGRLKIDISPFLRLCKQA